MTNVDIMKLELFWDDIPTEKEAAVTYEELKQMWNRCERNVRKILQDLSSFDNGDNYILLRSGKNAGFYKTDNLAEIKEYKQECLNKGRSLFAPIKKINRVINANAEQFSVENNMRVIREEKGMTQADVCRELNKYDKAIDKAMLSKMENAVCMPTPYQLAIMSRIYDCEPYDLIKGDLYY